ncbi:cobalamin B12-binding domain-containing protein [Roseobacter sp. CCS2]|uniref:cobalamin B12-binding domain-containing protein n=1 Tax=Roseobacter sp. CCS2 TaxID=391593 RepID=UPI0000F4041F|nr:cobalamin B12-binding domain-containing protein [Roseobacter sp. CCS2]EBA14109.1 cobalamin B12-binding protein [Roseobacter sp. CCS2]
MADRQNFDAKKESAVPEVAKRRITAAVVDDTVQPKLDETLYLQLKTAALNPDATACRRAVKASLAKGTSPEELADVYIPAIARDMGDRWCEDQLSFASVTIGVSRLQAMMRELGPNWASDNAAAPGAPSILLIVLQDVYHTLGAIVLTSQLRRKGFSVKLLLGCRSEDIAERIQRTKYHSVFISSSRGETLESLRRIVDVVKNSTDRSPPVVVGGTILDVETINDVTALTGADYATKIPDEALEYCGLQDIPHNIAHAKNGT